MRTRTLSSLIAFVGCLVLWAAPVERGFAAISFGDLLAEGGLVFQRPAGFSELPLEGPNPVFPYEYALRNDDHSLEIRYAVRPLSRIDIQYDDPHSSAPHPNDLFKMLFDQVTIELAGTRDNFSNTYPPEHTKEPFKAQWAAVALFDVDDRFSDKFQQGLLIAIHKDDKADAYIICMFDSYDDIKPIMNAIESSLTFTESPEASTNQ